MREHLYAVLHTAQEQHKSDFVSKSNNVLLNPIIEKKNHVLFKLFFFFNLPVFRDVKAFTVCSSVICLSSGDTVIW